MMKITLAFLILTLTGFANAQTESKCFRADSLSGGQTVAFKTNGNKISGAFTVESDDGETVKTYEFGGTRAGNVLRVKFAGNELPVLPPSSEMKSLNWTLSKAAGQEILRIKFYGKNYETNEYADYFAEFQPCEQPGSAALGKTAQTVQFAKGKTSATVPLSFKDTMERKVFSINIRRGQTLEIDAASCKISVYLPDEKPYRFVEWENENGTEKTFADSMIDKIAIKPVPQTGNYLVMLQKITEEARPGSVTFKITN